MFAEEAHLAMLRLREEKDEYIKQQEEQWRERLANREKEVSFKKSIPTSRALF